MSGDNVWEAYPGKTSREKCWDPYARLQVCTCSGYDLCHPGYIAYRQTHSHTHSQTERQTDSFWPYNHNLQRFGTEVIIWCNCDGALFSPNLVQFGWPPSRSRVWKFTSLEKVLNRQQLSRDCSISLKFRTDFYHVKPYVRQMFKVNGSKVKVIALHLSLIHIWRCRRSTLCRSRWSPYH